MAFKLVLSDKNGLAETLKKAGSLLDLDAVIIKQVTEIRDKAAGDWTPKDTGELRASVRANFSSMEVGYIKEYAPHVEYGHRTRGGGGIGFVSGQHFLQKNVDDQAPIYRQDLEERIRRITNG